MSFIRDDDAWWWPLLAIGLCLGALIGASC